MRKAVKATALLFTAAGAGLAATAAAEAGSFALREQSTIGLGQAYAGAAAGAAGLSSMYWNPATMTQFSGLQTELNVAGIFPNANVSPVAGTSPLLMLLGGTSGSGDIAADAALPSGYLSYQLTDKLWLGLAVNVPFGLSTKYPFNYSGQIYARESTVRSVDINPTIAYQVTDWLSLGLGVQALYFRTSLSQATSPLPYAPGALLEGQSWGAGVTAGVTVKPFAGTEIGLGYRSTVGESLSGDLSLGAKVSSLPAGLYGVDANLMMPDQVSLGIRQQITPSLTVSGGFEWTNWSRLNHVGVVGNAGLTNGATLTTLPFEYNDGYYLSIGAEYKLNENYTFRGGLGYEWSPITTTNRDLRVPDSNRLSVALGMGYRLNDNLSFDFGYSHLFTTGNGNVELVPGNPHYETGLPFVGSVSSDVDLVSVGMTYKFGTYKFSGL